MAPPRMIARKLLVMETPVAAWIVAIRTLHEIERRCRSDATWTVLRLSGREAAMSKDDKLRVLKVSRILSVATTPGDVAECVLFCESNDGLIAIHVPVAEAYKSLTTIWEAIEDWQKQRT